MTGFERVLMLTRSPCLVISRRLLPILLVSIGCWVAVAQAAPRPPDSEPLRWNTIEIVTNDFDSVERLRATTRIGLGALLALGDARIRQACESIRMEVPAKVVRCMQLFGGKTDGYIEAEYIVEIENEGPAPSAPLHCSPNQLAPDLSALREEWGRIQSTSKPTDDGPPERVNTEQYLDYNTPELHQQAQRVHSIVRTRVRELEQATNSCGAQSRADAIGFMNYTGVPSRAIQSASAHMDDPDLVVRDVAVRLLGVFNRFISKSEIPGIVKGACSLTFGGFADRNKSIILLNRMRRGGLISFGTLSAKCQEQIRAIARTSNAIQTGRPAQYLVESADARIIN
jgi:hypothetical protein